MWETAKLRFPAGRVVRGTVVAHHPYGISVDLGDPVAAGLVPITEFLDGGRMTPERYPAIGATVTAVVLGHTGEGRKQIRLCMRPSVIQRHTGPGAAADGGGTS
ncbi:MAG TPA: S1 RNA-binding domain-containing protein [Gemmataceae bacterium]